MAAGKRKRAKGRSFYEPRDMAAFVRRVSRAMVDRAVKDGDLEVLVAIREMRAVLDVAEVEAARAIYYGSPDPTRPLPGARTWGYSWTDVARELGVSRQAAMKRYADNRLVTENADHGAHQAAAAS